MEKKFYITTSIPYANAAPHIGFALEAIQADVLARTARASQKEVFFLTGTDEHGAKIAKAASQQGVDPQAFVDAIAEKFQVLASALNITTDDFIRTTDQKRHWPAVAQVWNRLRENGDLYEKEYEGLYCVGCEAFITLKDLADGACRIHGTKPEHIKERNWFFRLSKYESQIKQAIETDELHISPATRKHEMLNFVSEGLQDVSFSRPRKDLAWGIPVPGDDTQTIYVWADALVNYISVLGYPNGEKFKKYWPADVHAVGKDILRFHATIWPGILLALGLPLPRSIFVHGFINVAGKKMSKSLGNVVDPFKLIEEYGADAVRYFLLREIPSAEDGDFTEEKFQERYNADLAAGLGNLLARVLKVAQTARVAADAAEIKDTAIRQTVSETRKHVQDSLDDFKFGVALESIWEVIHSCDKLIEQEHPWKESSTQKETIATLLAVLAVIAELLQPFLPETAKKVSAQLQAGSGEPLFPRRQS